MVASIGSVPVALIVSLVGVLRDRPRGVAIVGLVISAGTGLFFAGLFLLALLRAGPLW